jgi:hypothetical protein
MNVPPSWQFITLAGLHTNALISNRFAKAFAVDGMKAYTTLIQEKEMEENCEVVKHQAVRCFSCKFTRYPLYLRSSSLSGLVLNTPTLCS